MGNYTRGQLAQEMEELDIYDLFQIIERLKIEERLGELVDGPLPQEKQVLIIHILDVCDAANSRVALMRVIYNMADATPERSTITAARMLWYFVGQPGKRKQFDVRLTPLGQRRMQASSAKLFVDLCLLPMLFACVYTYMSTRDFNHPITLRFFHIELGVSDTLGLLCLALPFYYWFMRVLLPLVATGVVGKVKPDEAISTFRIVASGLLLTAGPALFTYVKDLAANPQDTLKEIGGIAAGIANTTLGLWAVIIATVVIGAIFKVIPVFRPLVYLVTYLGPILMYILLMNVGFQVFAEIQSTHINAPLTILFIIMLIGSVAAVMAAILAGTLKSWIAFGTCGIIVIILIADTVGTLVPTMLGFLYSGEISDNVYWIIINLVTGLSVSIFSFFQWKRHPVYIRRLMLYLSHWLKKDSLVGLQWKYIPTYRSKQVAFSVGWRRRKISRRERRRLVAIMFTTMSWGLVFGFLSLAVMVIYITLPVIGTSNSSPYVSLWSEIMLEVIGGAFGLWMGYFLTSRYNRARPRASETRRLDRL